MPAEPVIVAGYLASLAPALKRSGLKRRLAAIAHHHRISGHPWIPGHPALRATLRGILEEHGVASRPAAAFTSVEVKGLLDHCGTDVAGLRDRALFLLGFAGALRRSELVALDREHLRFTEHGLALRLPRSKTDQEGEGATLGIPRYGARDTCPVRAIEAWLRRAGIAYGPVFRKVSTAGRLEARLTADGVWKILRRRAALAGLAVHASERLSPHGLAGPAWSSTCSPTTGTRTVRPPPVQDPGIRPGRGGVGPQPPIASGHAKRRPGRGTADAPPDNGVMIEPATLADDRPAALPARVPDADAMPHVDLAGFAGPIDRLLELARQHRVDLGSISAIALTDQVAAALEAAGQTVQLDRQGEWLVATTWLIWLKSRLLLSRHSVEARQVQDAVVAAVCRIELQAAAQAAAAWLDRRPQLGRDVFARGVPPRKARCAGFVALLEAGLIVFRGAQGRPEDAVYRPDPPRRLWRVVDALARVRAVLAAAPTGGELAMFLPRLDPGGAEQPLRAKAAVASTFLAGLELARAGAAALRQETAFAPIAMQAADAAAASGRDEGRKG